MVIIVFGSFAITSVISVSVARFGAIPGRPGSAPRFGP
jgi:hypothetical protein